LPKPRPLTIEPESGIDFSVVFEDEAILVIDKPPGLSVHPGAGRHSGTLVNALLDYLGQNLRQIGDALRPGIVHRLDKDTSGLMVVAKTQQAFRALVHQLKPPRSMRRRYVALTFRLPQRTAGSTHQTESRSGIISLPIGRHPQLRTKMAVVPTGKQASTSWSVREALDGAFVLDVELSTGRTHQIRVHLSHCAAPIIGDPVYGSLPQTLSPQRKKAVSVFGRQALHAASLSFRHPEDGRSMEFDSPLPEDMQRLIAAFRC
jgi:23S rRNA pseudouridine1911/1915/1917 synthase